jgi:hypothetical protein
MTLRDRPWRGEWLTEWDHRGKNETARAPSKRYREDIEWLLQDAAF